MEEIFGLGPCLEGACSATDLSDLFKAGSITPTPEPASYACVLIGAMALFVAKKRFAKKSA